MRKTSDTIVEIVMIEKIIVTINKPGVLFLAAGYIKMGINGSQGPNPNIKNNIHGVNVFDLASR